LQGETLGGGGKRENLDLRRHRGLYGRRIVPAHRPCEFGGARLRIRG
jgi:hypothetical protein